MTNPGPDAESQDAPTARGQVRCRRCGATGDPEDRYCRACGAALALTSTAPRGPAGVRALGLVVLAIAAVFALVHYGGLLEDDEPPPRPIPIGQVGTGPAANRAMTPDEAADHVFNQVMTAYEAGDTAQAERLAAMAMSAYRGLTDLDMDARYHMSLLHFVLGRPGAALAQADTILSEVPDHLLALLVTAEARIRMGEREAATEAYRRFLDAYDPTVASSRPEYTDHAAIFPEELERARRYVAAADGTQQGG